MKGESACAELLACGQREDAVATVIESLYSDAEERKALLQAEYPNLGSEYKKVFKGHSIERKLALQAEAELGGAITWHKLLTGAKTPTQIASFKACESLEEANTVEVLRILARGTDT